MPIKKVHYKGKFEVFKENIDWCKMTYTGPM